MNGEPGRREGGLKQGDRIVSLHPDSLAARLCRLYEAAGPPGGAAVPEAPVCTAAF